MKECREKCSKPLLLIWSDYQGTHGCLRLWSLKDGGSTGAFLLSALRISRSLRKHFRTFLMVKSPEGDRLYFRYYDPRVLRVYLPTCNADGNQLCFRPGRRVSLRG